MARTKENSPIFELDEKMVRQIKCVRTKDVIAVPGLGTISTLVLKEGTEINHLQGGCLCDSIEETDKGILFVESKNKKSFLFFNAILSHIEYKS